MVEKIMNNEIANSIKNNLKKRLDSPLYGVFLISWLLFHWEFIYTMFFVSEKSILVKTGLLKNEYLLKRFFDFSSIKFYILWIIPFVLTYFIIWKFPKWISLPAFKEEQKFELYKKIIVLDNNKIIKSKEAELEEEDLRKTKAVKEKKSEEKEIKDIDPTEIWSFEYQEFTKKPFSNKLFQEIINSVYKNRGHINSISSDVLAYAHSNGLVDFLDNKIQIEITDKGKFFIDKFYSTKMNDL